MIAMKFKQPRLYLRKDADAGWSLAVWRWRVFFNVRRSHRAK